MPGERRTFRARQWHKHLLDLSKTFDNIDWTMAYYASRSEAKLQPLIHQSVWDPVLRRKV